MSASQEGLFPVELVGIWNLFQYVILAKASLSWPIVLQHWWRIQSVRWCTLLHLVGGYNPRTDPSASVYSITLQDPCMCQIYKSVVTFEVLMVVNEDYHILVFWKTTYFCFFAEHNPSDMSTFSLPLLFLIPAALILVPGIAWVCCRWKQRRRRNCPPPHCRHDAVINIRREHHNNNPVHKQHRGTDSGFKYTSVSTTRHCGSNELKSNSSHVQYV